MNFAPLIAKKADRFRELESEIGKGQLYDDPKRAKDILREHMRLKELLANWDALEKSRIELRDSQDLAKGTDADMAEMAQAEIPMLENRIKQLEHAVQYALLPPDPNEDR